jgi:hypothetical protein
MNFKGIIISLFIFSGCCSYGQNYNLEFAKRELKLALSNKKNHNVIDNHRIIIKDSAMAIKVIEPILFGIYTEEEIKRQRPYKCVLVDNYWVVSGILQEDWVGGTFLIIMDARNGKIIKITHGK